LLFVGLVVMLFGFVAVLTSKILYPVIVEQIETGEVISSGALPVGDFDLQGVTYINGPPKNATKDGWYYFYWYAKETQQQLNETFHWIFHNMSGDSNVTMYISYRFRPQLTYFAFKISVSEPPKQTVIIYGCQDRLIFFGFYKNTPPVGNFSTSWLVRPDDEVNQCKENHVDRTDRWMRALYPVMASLFILCGCVCVAYWGYDKVKHPSAEMYEILSGRPFEIENF